MFAGPSKENLGVMLNNFNLLAVAVVIAASVKTQIYGMRKTVITMQKNLRLCAKFTHKFVRDPYGQCFYPAEVRMSHHHDTSVQGLATIGIAGLQMETEIYFSHAFRAFGILFACLCAALVICMQFHMYHRLDADVDHGFVLRTICIGCVSEHIRMDF